MHEKLNKVNWNPLTRRQCLTTLTRNIVYQIMGKRSTETSLVRIAQGQIMAIFFCHPLIICGTSKCYNGAETIEEENKSFPIRKCLVIIWCLPQSHTFWWWYKRKFSEGLCAQESETVCTSDSVDVMIFSANYITPTVH